MKAIGLYPAYAAAIRCGQKKIETRSWDIVFRGWIAFCSTLKTGNLPLPPSLGEWWGDKELPAGKLMCVARIVACYPVDYIEREFGLSARERELGGYGADRFGWMLDDVRATPLVPVTCRQGIFYLEGQALREAERVTLSPGRRDASIQQLRLRRSYSKPVSALSGNRGKLS